MKREDLKLFLNALDKKDRKIFDQMFDIPSFYISACSYSVQYVRLHPILMSIVFYHYKQLTECISKVEEIGTKVEYLVQQKKQVEVKLPSPARQLKLSEF